jgi:hypothetical protein
MLGNINSLPATSAVVCFSVGDLGQILTILDPTNINTMLLAPVKIVREVFGILTADSLVIRI